jgi:predicted nucleotidyltransferase
VGYIRDVERKPTGGTSDADPIIKAILGWARSQPGIRAVVLVGSHARGTPRPASDIDIVLLAKDHEGLRADATWVDQIDVLSIGAHPPTWADEDYGAAWSRRVWLDRGGVELTFAGLSWAAVNPADAGTDR